MGWMRTLVISDLHLGQRSGRSVLELERPLALLRERIADCDRLVLLGDVVEMQQSHWSRSFPIAEPVLRALGEACGPRRELILVPGNHDHSLLGGWAAAQGEALARESVVPHDASAQLQQVVSWLAPAAVQVRYPGVWLHDRVWAAHGHQLNHYLRPVSSVGLLHPAQRRRPAAPRSPAGYEYLPEAPARPPLRDGLPPQPIHERVAPLLAAPVLARLLGRQMLHHSLPAMARAAAALDVRAEFVVFGHVHRRGPLPDEDPQPWSARDGHQQLLNTGSWRFDAVLCHGARPPHPYWPGGAVVIEADGRPRSVGILDTLSESDFR